MKLTRIVLASATILALPIAIHAQPTAHYPPGVEGIKAASLPPPGVYVRDYNLFYFADRVNDPRGNQAHGADVDAFIYANVPRLVWITDQQVLGGFLGVDALIPLQYTSLEMNTPGGRFDDDEFGAGDFFFEGTWSRHAERYDASLAYGIWAPTGDSSLNPTRPGLGYWGHMFTAGLTWYIDEAKLWSISALNRYEINHEDLDTDVTPGHAYTLEWGLSRVLKPNALEAGVVGYFQQQVTLDSGTGASNHRDQVAAVGPEVSTFCPKLGLFTSLRYLYEFSAEDRLQGHAFVLTFTKKL